MIKTVQPTAYTNEPGGRDRFADVGVVNSTGDAGNEFEQLWDLRDLQRVDTSQPKPLPLDKSPGNLPVLVEPVQDEPYVQCRLLPVQGDELPWTSTASSGGNARASWRG